VAYASAGAHGCIAQAMDLAGLGSANLRKIPMNAQFQMDTSALEAAITADRQAGLQPFFIAATAGTVDVGQSMRCQWWPPLPSATGCGSTSMARMARWRRCRPSCGRAGGH
jgi:hypothetical protein